MKEVPIIQEGANIGKLLYFAAEKQNTSIQSGDILVVTHVIVSRAEGKTVNLDELTPSKFAENIAKQYKKDPALVELVLREAKNIRRMGNNTLITETKHGFVCANSGIDKSNVPGRRIVALLPEDPDKSADKIRKEIKKISGKNVAVIVSDTHGRPLRNGEINVAIGVAGINPIWDHRGEVDLFNYILLSKKTAIADEIASAAELVIGQTNEGIPAALIRGYPVNKTEKTTAKNLLRPKNLDLFL